MRETLRVIPLAICVLVSQAAAQTGGLLIESSNVVSPSQPTTSIEVWAWFDDPSGERNAFAAVDFSFIAADGEFSNAQMHLWTAGLSSGTVLGNRVNGVVVAQFWGYAGLTANIQNPILVWSADWTTTDFTSRSVSLNTFDTTSFYIGTNSTHSGMNELQLYPQGFTPGTGMIEVVPSPATMTPLLALGALTLRRRRPSQRASHC